LSVVVASYVALVASHGGEFWPFSMFPMFSGAGRPWQRALTVRVDEGLLHGELPASYALDHLPGEPFPLLAHGIPQNDLSSLVQRAERWDQAEQRAFGQLFNALPCSALPLLVLRVRGSLADGAVEELATPLASLSCEAGQQRLQLLLQPGPRGK
jgi:hypothetical protein